MIEVMSEIQNEVSIEKFEQTLVNTITVVAYETGWKIDDIMEMDPVQFFQFARTIGKIYDDHKKEAEFLGRVNSSVKILGE